MQIIHILKQVITKIDKNKIAVNMFFSGFKYFEAQWQRVLKNKYALLISRESNKIGALEKEGRRGNCPPPQKKFLRILPIFQDNWPKTNKNRKFLVFLAPPT